MKLKNLLLATASGFFMFSGVSYGQSVSRYGCYTDEHNHELEMKNPGLAQSRAMLEQQIQQYLQQNPSAKTNNAVLKVPVVVHIVTENGTGGISKAQVENGIQVLNEDFRRLNADTSNTRGVFKTYAADMEIEFVLARLDPQGQPTEGIVRVTSHTTKGPVTRDNVKIAAPSWPTNKYFNVWLVDRIESPPNSQILGYAQFPNMPGRTWDTYGLVMLHRQWGKQGAIPGSTANSDGRTATHEVGHCFNLYHTFQGGCGSTCNNSGDLVCDTPPSPYATYNNNCNPSQNLCANDASGPSVYTGNVQDQTENYMSYDLCQNMFTLGQRDRAHAALSTVTQLQNLTSTNSAIPSNAMVTGIDPNATVGPLVPQPYFSVSAERLCAGSSIIFQDQSYNGTATSLTWTFQGGTPATSTDVSPVVTYNTPGVYPVTLTAANAVGSRSVTKTGFIKVSPVTNLAAANNSDTYFESFEDSGFPNNSFPTHIDANKSWDLETTEVKQNPNNWVRSGQAAATGSYSMRLNNNPNVIDEGTISSLITPNIDTRGLTSSVYFSFKLAFGRKSSNGNPVDPQETLRVFMSTDCGKTWINKFSKSGNALVTSSLVSNNFSPTSPGDWREERVFLPANQIGNNLMFKIEGVSAGGNSIYLDDFKLFSLLGTNEDIALENNIKVYPNPVTPQTGINFDLKTAESVSVKIFDLVGNVVYQQEDKKFGAGSHTIGLHDKVKNYSTGMYLVELNLGNKVYNTKLIVQ